MYVLDPLHDFVIVEAMPAVMQRIGLKDPDAPLPATARRDGLPLIATPDDIASSGVGADKGTGRGGAVTSLLAGRVLWIGEGRVREGVLQKPNLKRGSLVIFLPRTVSYEFLLHGRQIKLVPWHEIPTGVREVAADSAEWLEFLALVEEKAALPVQSEAS